MDKDKETQILNRLEELEARLAALEEQVRSMTRSTPDFPNVPIESDSDEPIIDG